MNYYTADLHLGHENILRLSKRPFASVEEMDEMLIKNWNSTVGADDNVYIVGDLVFKSRYNGADYYLKQLNGHKHLIIGNHDGKMLKQPNINRYFESIQLMADINDNGKRIILCHYPLAEWNGFFRGAYHFFGHIHNTKNETYEIMKKIPNAFNVGVDVQGFYPRTADEIISKKFLVE